MTKNKATQTSGNGPRWTPDFDMDSIPYDVLRSHWKSRVARLGADKSGRPRTCGHSGEYQADCDICQRAKELKNKRGETKK